MKFKIILIIMFFALNNQLIKCAAACEAVDKDSFEWMANSSDVNDALAQFMFKSIENDQVDEKFCKENANLINIQHPVTGTTPIMYACQLKKEGIAKLFLATDKINLNLTDKEGKTALIHAVLGGLNIVDTVLKNGAELDHQDLKGFTAVMHATQKEYKPIIRSLLLHKPNLKIQSKNGEEACYLAVISGDPEIIDMVAKEMPDASASALNLGSATSLPAS